MSTTNTGTDDINLAPENDDFDDANVDVHANDDDSGDATGQGNINVPVPRARTPFPPRISSDGWRIWLKQTDGRMPRPTTTSPTHSGTRQENGYHP
jgi:hypothetical protein